MCRNFLKSIAEIEMRISAFKKNKLHKLAKLNNGNTVFFDKTGNRTVGFGLIEFILIENTEEIIYNVVCTLVPERVEQQQLIVFEQHHGKVIAIHIGKYRM